MEDSTMVIYEAEKTQIEEVFPNLKIKFYFRLSMKIIRKTYNKGLDMDGTNRTLRLN